MARLATICFEPQIFGTVSNSHGDSEIANSLVGQAGTQVVNTTVSRTGAACCEQDMGANNYIAPTFSGVLDRPYYVRVYFRFSDATPVADVTILSAVTTGVQGKVVLKANGTLQLQNTAGTQVGSSSPVLADNAWYKVEFLHQTNTAGNGNLALILNGLTVVSTTAASISNIALASLRIGSAVGNASNAGMKVYIDDIAVNDNQAGTGQTSYPGNAKVAFLKPTSVSARGTWVGPQTTGDDTTNLEQNVDNTPPLGTSLAAGYDVDANNGKFVFNITNTANQAFDVNLETYTAAGIVAGDTIRLTHAMVRASVDSTTGTNTLGVSGVSNPAMTNRAGQNLEVNAIAGTEPAGWKSFRSEIAYAPSVTLGTAPVIRGNKEVASTRVSGIDLMGMYVEYTPATQTKQSAYRGRSNDTALLNDSGGGTFAAAAGTGWTQLPDTTFRVRIQVIEDNLTETTLTGQLEARKNGGSWQDVTTSSTIVKAVASSQFNEGDATTDVLGGNTDMPFVAGSGVEDGVAASISSFGGLQTEHEYALQLVGANVAAADLVEVRVKGLTNYPDVPQITVGAAATTVDSLPLDLVWNMRAEKESNRNFLWDMRAELNRNLSFIWNMRAETNNNRAFLWDMRAEKESNRNFLWDMRAEKSNTATLKWDMYTDPKSGTTMIWNVTSTVSASQKTLIWDMRAEKESNRNFIWDMRAEVNRNVSFIWGLYNTVAASQKTLLWDMRAERDANRNFLWDMRAEKDSNRNFLWDLRAERALTNTLVWNTRAEVSSLPLDLLWGLYNTVSGQTNTLKWDMRADINSSLLDLVWNMRGDINSLAQTLKWDMRAEVASSLLDLVWNMRAERGQSVSLKWELLVLALAVTILSGPTRTRVSRQSGFDSLDFSWSANGPFQHYQVRSVPSGVSGQTAGALVEQDQNPASGGTTGTEYTVTITDDEIVNADPTEGNQILKVFVQDMGGSWST